MGTLKIKLHFGSGSDLLFNKLKTTDVKLPPLHKYFPDSIHSKWIFEELLVWIKDNLLKERSELFLQDDSVRPGILVLINGTDWELYGALSYVIRDGDQIMFLSSLD